MVRATSSKSESFQSTLSVRRATGTGVHPSLRQQISIHALREESDADDPWSAPVEPISIHALREESDSRSISQKPGSSAFQSTLSVRRATRKTITKRRKHNISIHALREESDNTAGADGWSETYFNPRSP